MQALQLYLVHDFIWKTQRTQTNANNLKSTARQVFHLFYGVWVIETAIYRDDQVVRWAIFVSVSVYPMNADSFFEKEFVSIQIRKFRKV